MLCMLQCVLNAPHFAARSPCTTSTHISDLPCIGALSSLACKGTGLWVDCMHRHLHTDRDFCSSVPTHWSGMLSEREEEENAKHTGKERINNVIAMRLADGIVCQVCEQAKHSSLWHLLCTALHYLCNHTICNCIHTSTVCWNAYSYCITAKFRA